MQCLEQSATGLVNKQGRVIKYRSVAVLVARQQHEKLMKKGREQHVAGRKMNLDCMCSYHLISCCILLFYQMRKEKEHWVSIHIQIIKSFYHNAKDGDSNIISPVYFFHQNFDSTLFMVREEYFFCYCFLEVVIKQVN